MKKMILGYTIVEADDIRPLVKKVQHLTNEMDDDDDSSWEAVGTPFIWGDKICQAMQSFCYDNKK